MRSSFWPLNQYHSVVVPYSIENSTHMQRCNAGYFQIRGSGLLFVDHVKVQALLVSWTCKTRGLTKYFSFIIIQSFFSLSRSISYSLSSRMTKYHRWPPPLADFLVIQISSSCTVFTGRVVRTWPSAVASESERLVGNECWTRVELSATCWRARPVGRRCRVVWFWWVQSMRKRRDHAHKATGGGTWHGKRQGSQGRRRDRAHQNSFRF